MSLPLGPVPFPANDSRAILFSFAIFLANGLINIKSPSILAKISYSMSLPFGPVPFPTNDSRAILFSIANFLANGLIITELPSCLGDSTAVATDFSSFF